MTTEINFEHLLWRAGFNGIRGFDRKAICEFLFVSERTLERWISLNKPCPRAVQMLKERAAGIQLSGGWNGFYICRKGFLHTPNGYHYEPEQIKTLHLVHGSIRYHEGEIATLQAEIKRLSEIIGARDRIKEIGEELVEISEAVLGRDILDFLEKMEEDKQLA